MVRNDHAALHQLGRCTRCAPARTALTESILDNLSAWTVVALLIGLLYLVWATLAILDKYVGDIPSLGA